MSDQLNQDVLIEQLRGHVKQLIKQLTTISTLWGIVILALVGGFHTIQVQSFKVNFFYGSVIIYLIICYEYLLCGHSLDKIYSLGASIGGFETVERILKNEPGFLSPFTPPYLSLIFSNLLPFIFYFIVMHISVPVIVFGFMQANSLFIHLSITLLLYALLAFTYGRYFLKLIDEIEIYVEEKIIRIHMWSTGLFFSILVVSSFIRSISFYSNK